MNKATQARIAVSLIFLVFGLLVGTWLPYIPEAKNQIGLTDKQIGQALLCSGFGAVVTMQLVGHWIGRFGSRNVSVVTAMMACVSVPFLLMHHTLVGLCINLLVVGGCYGALDAAMNAHAIEVQGLHEKSVLASIHGFFSSGGILGGGLAALASKLSISPKAHLAGTGVFLFALAIACRTFLLPSSVDKGSVGSKFTFPKGFVLLLGVLCGAAFLLEGGIADWCALYVRDELKADPFWGGVIVSVCSGAMAIGRFVGDPILSRLGNRRSVLYGGTVAFVGVAVLFFTPPLWLTILSLGVASLGLANVVPAIFNEAGKVQGISTGASIAAVTTCGYGGFLMGPPIIGLMSDQVSLSVAMGSLSLLGLLLLLGSNWVPRKA
jgi:MFS family permease